jgi:hypothetical protein
VNINLFQLFETEPQDIYLGNNYFNPCFYAALKYTDIICKLGRLFFHRFQDVRGVKSANDLLNSHFSFEVEGTR